MQDPEDPRDRPRTVVPEPPAGDRPGPYRELFERSADAILIIEGETFVDCNQAAVEMLRCRSREEVLETHPSGLSPPTQPDGRSSFEKANEMIALAFEQGSHRFEWDHRRADGEVFPVEVLLTAVREQGRRILHVVWRDITDRKRLESQLRHAQKMEAIGKLAGGIAHDFNNLLVAILGNAELLAEALQDEPELLEGVDQVRTAGERAAGLVRQLLAFGRRQDLELRKLDLNEALTRVDKLIRRLIGEDVELVTRPSTEPVVVHADPGQIEQVVINLVTNARDAMPRGGTLTLEVRRIQVGEALVGQTAELEPGAYAVLTVSDTGSGMDEETLRRACEPFFTTKGVGAGTGLGLATVYGIADQSGGSIEIQSRSSAGTLVSVYLPLAEGPAEVEPARKPRLSSAGGGETLLVAEDEEVVSALLVRVLETEGYRVLHAADGLVALDLFRRHGEEIDLLLTDVVMPHMGGVELVRELRSQGWDPPILYASGYSDALLEEVRAAGEKVDLLSKPFTATELLRRVREALDRRK